MDKVSLGPEEMEMLRKMPCGLILRYLSLRVTLAARLKALTVIIALVSTRALTVGRLLNATFSSTYVAQHTFSSNLDCNFRNRIERQLLSKLGSLCH